MAEPQNRRRKNFSITLDPDDVAWLDQNSGRGRFFKSRSDGIEWCIHQARSKGSLPTPTLRSTSKEDDHADPSA